VLGPTTISKIVNNHILIFQTDLTCSGFTFILFGHLLAKKEWNKEKGTNMVPLKVILQLKRRVFLLIHFKGKLTSFHVFRKQIKETKSQ